MYWLQPPPRLRRAMAVLLVIGAMGWDLSSGGGAPYPVAARALVAGTVLTEEDVAWIDLPVGALPDAAAPMGRATAREVAPGEPLSDAVLSGPVAAPPGWWTVPIAVGTLAAPGDEALLVIADPPLSVVGLVLETQVGDTYDVGHRPAAVAVPADVAPLVAAAEQQGVLVTAVRPRSAGQ